MWASQLMRSSPLNGTQAAKSHCRQECRVQHAQGGQAWAPISTSKRRPLRSLAALSGPSSLQQPPATPAFTAQDAGVTAMHHQPLDTGCEPNGSTSLPSSIANNITPFPTLSQHLVSGPEITPITTYTADPLVQPYTGHDGITSSDSSSDATNAEDVEESIATVAKVSGHIKRTTTTSVVWHEPQAADDEEEEANSKATKVTADRFKLEHVAIPRIKEGEVLVELVYLSMDSFARSRMRRHASKESARPLRGLALGLVKQSKAAQLSAGDLVCGFLSWQQLQAVQATGMHAVDVRVLRELGLPSSVYLNALGVPGLAAYAALSRIAKPGPEQTVFISGAAGAVGLIAGQLCKNMYECANVVGSAKTDQKVEIVRAHGYDSAFNFTNISMADGIAQTCPFGVDVYVDNVGGAALQAVLDACNTHARVVACGALQQHGDRPCYGVTNLHHIATKRILLQGLSVIDHLDLRDEFLTEMTQHLRHGHVRSMEQVMAGGLTAAGTAFLNLLDGANIGKMVVQCADDPFRH